VKEQTLTIVKPDAVSKGLTGAILQRLEQNGFRIVGLKRLRLTDAQARGFYHVHRERPFFAGLIKFMTEGPVVVAVLEREDAIAKLREIMGATNPEKAAPGTIRKDFATDIERNAIHGSDAAETARYEIGFFFPASELL
jgi:nucleoside-diphosphate kinase